jgi:hypothetical protein
MDGTEGDEDEEREERQRTRKREAEVGTWRDSRLSQGVRDGQLVNKLMYLHLDSCSIEGG